CQNYLTSPFIF
nr:immunoglobulin light chain junction region [Macaca mulatta]